MKPMLSYLVSAFLLIGSPTSMKGQGDPKLPVSPNATGSDWTVMVYMNANNNLEPDAFVNFAEMANVDANPAVNVIVQFARQAEYTPSPDWKGALRFKMRRDIEPTLEDSLNRQADANMNEDHIPNPNMGDVKTLCEFVEWAEKQYPARHYMLVIWDHGDGWRAFDTIKINAPKKTLPVVLEKVSNERDSNLEKARELSNNVASTGEPERDAKPKSPVIPVNKVMQTATFRAISIDDAHDGAKLYNYQIQNGLQKLLGSRKLDVIGFDACLMAMVETSYAMRNVASVMVGSEELEPGKGWNYTDWIGRLCGKSLMEPEELAGIIVAAYESYYKNLRKPTTLSCVKLSGIETLATSIDEFSDALIRNVKTRHGSDVIRNARSSCFVYAPGCNLHGVDLGQFCDLIATMSDDPKVIAQAQKVRADLNKCVVANYRSVDRPQSNGLAIYFPASETLFRTDPSKEGYDKDNTDNPVEFVKTRRWVSFLQAYFNKVP